MIKVTFISVHALSSKGRVVNEDLKNPSSTRTGISSQRKLPKTKADLEEPTDGTIDKLGDAINLLFFLNSRTYSKYISYIIEKMKEMKCIFI